ncbi:MAG: hypothetical protein GY940_10655 [bacterium]|nr:hypothetical protein [bacterium]
MGSRKPFPEEGLKLSSDPETHITILMNTVYYYLDSVFIVIAEDHCRLLALHNRKLVVDECYETLRGAKIAFYRMYKEKACVSGLKPEWSVGYVPEKEWLDERLEAMPHPIYPSELVTRDSRVVETM